MSGSVSGCNYGVYAGTGHTVSGSVSGCTNGVNASSVLFRSNSSLGYKAGVVNANTYDVRFPCLIVCRSTQMATPPTFFGRNSTSDTGAWGGLYCENYGLVLGASVAFLPYGTLTKQASVVRAGGASTALKCDPESNCAAAFPMLLFEWTEASVPASAQNKSVYLRGGGWSSFPTNAQLWVEALYVSNGTTFAITETRSTAVLADNTTWVEFAIPEFTPAVAAHVRYRGWLATYEAGASVYVDAQLV